MIVCRNNTRSEVIQMAKNFPFEVTRIFAHFQMEIFYNFKFCYNRRLLQIQEAVWSRFFKAFEPGLTTWIID
jgi:hypothetical protein